MKNDTATAHAPKEILNEVKALIDEAETIMTGAPSDLTVDALGTLRERFDAAQERFSELYAGARKKVVAGAKCTDEAIRENPYQALAIALGVGAVLGSLAGLMIGRRRS